MVFSHFSISFTTFCSALHTVSLRPRIESESEEEEEEEIPLLSEEEMNRLASELVKAEIRGKTVSNLSLYNGLKS